MTSRNSHTGPSRSSGYPRNHRIHADAWGQFSSEHCELPPEPGRVNFRGQELCTYMHGVIHESKLQPDACWACMGILRPRQIVGSPPRKLLRSSGRMIRKQNVPSSSIILTMETGSVERILKSLNCGPGRGELFRNGTVEEAVP